MLLIVRDSFHTQPSLCFAAGDDVRRYLAGPPGPQGPPGPPGSSVGISASYSVDEIAMHIYNIMNGSYGNHTQFQKSDPAFLNRSNPIIAFFRERNRQRSTRSTWSSWSYWCSGLWIRNSNHRLLGTHEK